MTPKILIFEDSELDRLWGIILNIEYQTNLFDNDEELYFDLMERARFN